MENGDISKSDNNNNNNNGDIVEGDDVREEKGEGEDLFFDEQRPKSDVNGVSAASSTATSSSITKTTNVPWKPSGSFWKDLWYFVGPGWMVSIAYVDPGNYQADIQAGSTSRYSLLFAIWWTSILSMYVQILCVRLAIYGRMTLAEAQAHDAGNQTWKRYMNWFLAEFLTVITDLPEVIGIGIACQLFFGWPYYVGVLMSLITTMLFLSTQSYGVRVLEGIVFVFVGIMSIALWVEMSMVHPHSGALMEGWIMGFTSVQKSDIFTLAGILGAVVMPHNLYLHSAAVQSRPIVRDEGPSIVQEAVRLCSLEPILPILVSFFVNMAVVTISAESVYGNFSLVDKSLERDKQVGITNFCDFFSSIQGGCILWAIALLAAGQSSAITTTYTGQYVMDGFLDIQLPIHYRAIVTRLVAITPCVIVSVMFPNKLNEMVNIVNAALGFLLPFALTPLVKFNCSPEYLGNHATSSGFEYYILHTLAIAVWAINALALSIPGGGFFGDISRPMGWSFLKILLLLIEITIQAFYAWWNYSCLFTKTYSSTTNNYACSSALRQSASGEELNQPLGHVQLSDQTRNNHHHHQPSNSDVIRTLT